MFRNSMKKLLLSTTALAAAISLALAACGDNRSMEYESASDSSTTAEKPSIVVTTNILGDVVSNMVGDTFTVEVIMPPGSDPHDFQASAQQVDKMMNADLLVVNGANFEEGMLDVIEAAEAEGVMVFEAISVVGQLEGGDDHSDHGGHDDHEGHDHGGVDPHFFTDPARMAQVVDGLTDFLVANFPAVDESSLTSTANSYQQQLQTLDAEVEDLLSAIPSDARMLVTNHSVFAYFADRYQFEILGSIIPSSSTLSSASAQQLASLAEELRSEQVPAIFADASSSSSLAETLAGEVGNVKVITLFTESLGEPGSDGANYIAMVKFNAQEIVRGLVE